MTENRIPPDSAEYLAGPMPKYQDGIFTVHGKKVDANKLKPIDPESLQEASFKDFLHPRGRGGEWIRSEHGLERAATASPATSEIEKLTSPPPRQESLNRMTALGLDVTPPGPKTKMSDQDFADIADVLESAFKQYPVLTNGPGPPLKAVRFMSNKKSGKMGSGVLADCGIRQMVHKEGGWNVPGEGQMSVLRLNDRYGYGLKPAGPPPPGTEIGGQLSASSRSWAGVTWHELGHALMNAIDMAGHHDSKRYEDWMSRYGVSFEDSKKISKYAVASRSEGIAEMSSMENTPGYNKLLPPDLQPKVAKMFQDLRNWDPSKKYVYQPPLPGSVPPPVKPTPKATPAKPTYTLPPHLADIEASVKANPGTIGEKKPIADLHLTPGDVIQGSGEGLRYLIVSDPSEKTGLRYVPLNQGVQPGHKQPQAYRFSSTSKRYKTNLHFDGVQ
jgi:hypothetical protein